MWKPCKASKDPGCGQNSEKEAAGQDLGSRVQGAWGAGIKALTLEPLSYLQPPHLQGGDNWEKQVRKSMFKCGEQYTSDSK